MAALRPALPLTHRCVDGEPGAWRELHREFHPQAIRFLRRLGVPDRESEDLGQEVFVQVFRYLDRFEGRADFRTWLYKLCVSQANRFRRSRVPLFLGWLRGGVPADVVGVSPAWTEEEMAQRAQRALERMKPAHREAFVLFELEGLSGEQIADVFGCPVATVWRRLSYARREFEAWVHEGPLREARR